MEPLVPTVWRAAAGCSPLKKTLAWKPYLGVGVWLADSWGTWSYPCRTYIVLLSWTTTETPKLPQLEVKDSHPLLVLLLDLPSPSMVQGEQLAAGDSLGLGENSISGAMFEHLG